MQPTREQQQAIDAFTTGGDLKIIAGAGTGKTSTLSMLSDAARGRRGVYLAFNKAMADDAKTRMPSNVAVSTAHSLAFRGTRAAYATKIGSRMTARQAAQIAGLPSKMTLGNEITKEAAELGYYLLDWVRSFCSSDSPQIGLASMTYASPLGWLHVDPEYATRDDFRAARNLVAGLVPYVQRLWAAMADPQNSAPATHDVYLKQWVLSGPDLGADFILFDEAQDANPLMLQLVQSQQAQRVFVGDPNQQIYAWRGATNAMQSVQTPYTTTLSESFRFGPRIAEFANFVLETYCNSSLRLTGRGKPAPSNSCAVICRTNAGVISALSGLNPSDVYVAGGTEQAVSLLRGMQDLRLRGRTNNANLAHFNGWDEFVEHVGKSRDEMSTLLRLSKNGENINPLIDLLARVRQTAAGASRVVSTGHKCKGLEWDHVTLDGDFVTPGPEGDVEDALYNSERANLLYVAGTRAKRALWLADEFDALNCDLDYSDYDDSKANAPSREIPEETALPEVATSEPSVLFPGLYRVQPLQQPARQKPVQPQQPPVQRRQSLLFPDLQC